MDVAVAGLKYFLFAFNFLIWVSFLVSRCGRTCFTRAANDMLRHGCDVARLVTSDSFSNLCAAINEELGNRSNYDRHLDPVRQRPLGVRQSPARQFAALLHCLLPGARVRRTLGHIRLHWLPRRFGREPLHDSTRT